MSLKKSPRSTSSNAGASPPPGRRRRPGWPLRPQVQAWPNRRRRSVARDERGVGEQVTDHGSIEAEELLHCRRIEADLPAHRVRSRCHGLGAPGQQRLHSPGDSAPPTCIAHARSLARRSLVDPVLTPVRWRPYLGRRECGPRPTRTQESVPASRPGKPATFPAGRCGGHRRAGRPGPPGPPCSPGGPGRAATPGTSGARWRSTTGRRCAPWRPAGTTCGSAPSIRPAPSASTNCRVHCGCRPSRSGSSASTCGRVLPQAVEGALTVLVLYRAVRRLAGPVAAMVAAAVLVVSPATMTLDRGNIPDTLMVLCLVLAADATTTAILGGRWRSMLLAGLWVGLAFQAKMLEAWLVLPAIAVAVLVAGPGSAGAARRRHRRPGVGAAAVVSLLWMTIVALTPAAGRPYVDGGQRLRLRPGVRLQRPRPGRPTRPTRSWPAPWSRPCSQASRHRPGTGCSPPPTAATPAGCCRWPCWRPPSCGCAAAAPGGSAAGGRHRVGTVADCTGGGVHRQHGHELLLRRRPLAGGGGADRDRSRISLGASAEGVDRHRGQRSWWW